MKRSLAPVLSFLLVAGAAHARAQDGARWGVVAVTVSDDPARVATVADQVYAQLSVSGRTLVDDAALGHTVSDAVSAPPRDAPHAIVVRLSDGANEVARNVAAGRDGAALDEARAILVDVEGNLPALGRDESSAENVRNLCLFVVRAHLDAHRRSEATAAALECVRLSPDFTQPSAHWHPPDVVSAYRAARATLDAPGHATLVVQTAPGDPDHCTVRDGGRPMGTAPLRVAVAPGVHQVQVECQENRPARVHVVTVAAGAEAHVVVPARFDEALRTSPRVALVYGDREAMGEHLAEDVARVGRAAQLAHALVVRDDDGRVFLRHFLVPSEGNARSAGSSLVESPSDGDALRAAVDSVTSGLAEEADEGAGDVGEAAHEAAGSQEHGGGSATHAHRAPTTVPQRRSELPTTFGVVSGLTGALGLATGWGFFVWLELARDAFVPSSPTVPGYTKLEAEFDTASLATGITGLAAGAVLTVSLPWLLPEEDGVPWWAWLSGALGVAATGTAVALAAIAPPYVDHFMARREPQLAIAGLVLGNALPLLAVPLVYALRGPRTAPSVRVTASLGGLAVSGEW